MSDGVHSPPRAGQGHSRPGTRDRNQLHLSQKIIQCLEQMAVAEGINTKFWLEKLIAREALLRNVLTWSDPLVAHMILLEELDDCLGRCRLESDPLSMEGKFRQEIEQRADLAEIYAAAIRPSCAHPTSERRQRFVHRTLLDRIQRVLGQRPRLQLILGAKATHGKKID